MANFKYTGIQTSGAVIKGVINSSDKRSALKSIRLLALKRSFQIKKVIAERTFEYKVRKGNEKAVTGEQKAFDRSEVETALRKLGYRIIYVRNMPFSLRMKPSYKDIVIFIRICADLLREKLPYDEILQTVGTDMENKILKRTIRDISNDLKEGKEGREVFGKHEKIFGKFPTHMLSVASTSGNMAAVYESAARFMERNEEFKKNLRQVLVMPLVVSFFMMAAVIFYVAYIFPKTVELFTQYDIEIPPMTAATMKFSQFLQDNFMLLSIITISMIAAFIQFFRSPRGRYILDKLIIKIPYAGGLLHKTSIEIFARVFHALYSESGDNLRVIKTAAEACRNKYMESRIKNVAIPLMLKDGLGLIESLEATGVFTKTALSRFRSGSEAGALKSASLQLANYYERETSYKMKAFIDLVNILISVVIVLVVIALTVVSSETAVIRPKMPGLKY